MHLHVDVSKRGSQRAVCSISAGVPLPLTPLQRCFHIAITVMWPVSSSDHMLLALMDLPVGSFSPAAAMGQDDARIERNEQ